MATHSQSAFSRPRVEPINDELRERTSSIAEDVENKMKIYFDEATDWLQQNYGKTLMAVGLLTAAGLTGYFIARGQREQNKET